MKFSSKSLEQDIISDIEYAFSKVSVPTEELLAI